MRARGAQKRKGSFKFHVALKNGIGLDFELLNGNAKAARSGGEVEFAIVCAVKLAHV